MNSFAKTFNCFHLFIIFVKSSILDVWMGIECTSNGFWIICWKRRFLNWHLGSYDVAFLCKSNERFFWFFILLQISIKHSFMSNTVIAFEPFCYARIAYKLLFSHKIFLQKSGCFYGWFNAYNSNGFSLFLCFLFFWIIFCGIGNIIETESNVWTKWFKKEWKEKRTIPCIMHPKINVGYATACLITLSKKYLKVF